jgi:hypothetical protein
MYLTTQKSNTTNFKPVPAGTYLGRLYKLVDIGTQQGEWQGKVTYQRKVIFHFELFGEDDFGNPLLRDDGKPFIITKYYNRTLNEKSTLRKHLQAWLKIDFDKLENPFKAEDLLGKFATVSVSQYEGKNGDMKSSIDSLSAVPAMVSKHGLPEGINEIFMFDLDKFDSEKFAKLSDGVKGMIQQSPEYRGLMQKPENKQEQSESKQEDFSDDMNDPIPF